MFKFVPQELKNREEVAKKNLDIKLSKRIIYNSIDLSGNQYLTDLGMIEEIHGNLDLSNCKNLESLSNLKLVHGDVILANCEKIENLGKLEFVSSFLSINYCRKIKDLVSLYYCKIVSASYTSLRYIENEDRDIKYIGLLKEFNKVFYSIKEFNEFFKNKI